MWIFFALPAWTQCYDYNTTSPSPACAAGHSATCPPGFRSMTPAATSDVPSPRPVCTPLFCVLCNGTQDTDECRNLHTLGSRWACKSECSVGTNCSGCGASVAMPNCRKCHASYDHNRSDSVCQPVCDVPNCSLCALGNSSTCERCDPGYAGPSCAECTVAKCSACAPSHLDKCTTCHVGYNVSGDGTQCAQDCIVAHCGRCKSQNRTSCEQCATGWELSDKNECEPEGINAGTACVIGGVCVSCAVFFFGMRRCDAKSKKCQAARKRSLEAREAQEDLRVENDEAEAGAIAPV